MQKPTTHQELLRLIDQAADEGWEELDLSGLGLEELPKSIGRLTGLKRLMLGKIEENGWIGNSLTEIPAILFELTQLQELDLRKNQITVIPDEIAQLTNLTSLGLNNNQIKVIPDAIAKLENLTSLDLGTNQITSVPAAIAQLKNLADINLGTNQFMVVPEEILQLSNLTFLGLHNNKRISVIPDTITQLKSLATLYLYTNQITVIPDSIAQLTNLTKISFHSNQITVIPDSIAQLTNLTEIYFAHNQISTIPEAIAQLKNLTVLHLGNNQITVIPEAISQLKNLTLLYLWNNQIAIIPESINQLGNLTQLTIGSNQITVIPEAITQLTSLEKLVLSNNSITANLEDLEKLQVLTKLEMLNLQGNFLPLSPETLEEAVKNPSAIFNYLQQLHSGEVRPLNEAKVLLVGQGSVGKTSLINRLIHNHYNPTQPQTDGLAITHWPIHIHTKSVRLNVWDFGGQEIYHATHQFFLTKRSLYLLVCNCRTSEDENRLEYWLKLIASFGGASPVIIVGNKCDEQPLDINRKALRDKYPNIKAILETSCADNRGIADLRTAIHTEIAQLKEVYDLLPLTWFQVKEQLEQLEQTGKDFITISEYATLCAQHHILTEADQTQLVTLLHNLGLVLNFRDHPILQSTNILNPNWVTHGIYQLLSDEPLKTQAKGLLDCAELHRILDAQRYPPTRHRYLTELMREFQLCFELPDRPGHQFLIPGLLPKEEPADTHLDDDTLEFQYHYRILPDSILSRFIVLSHEKIHRHTYWRSGVMLQHCESAEICNLARIKSDPADGKIFIAINGRASTRRSFLALIRDTFTKIHNSFGNLEVEEFVPVPGYPDHPPLDYQELLGLEEMGDREYRVGKLKLRLDLRQLLDGYESVEARQRQRIRDRDFDGSYGREYEDLVDIAKRMASRPIINKAEATAMTDQSSKTNNFNGPMSGIIGSDNAQVSHNQFSQTNPSQNLTQAAQDIKDLLEQLDQDYDSSTPTGQAMMSAKAIENIDKNPTLKARVVNALKEGGTTALESAIDHPAVKPVVAMLKGFMDAK